MHKKFGGSSTRNKKARFGDFFACWFSVFRGTPKFKGSLWGPGGSDQKYLFDRIDSNYSSFILQEIIAIGSKP